MQQNKYRVKTFLPLVVRPPNLDFGTNKTLFKVISYFFSSRGRDVSPWVSSAPEEEMQNGWRSGESKRLSGEEGTIPVEDIARLVLKALLAASCRGAKLLDVSAVEELNCWMSAVRSLPVLSTALAECFLTGSYHVHTQKARISAKQTPCNQLV